MTSLLRDRADLNFSVSCVTYLPALPGVTMKLLTTYVEALSSFAAFPSGQGGASNNTQLVVRPLAFPTNFRNSLGTQFFNPIHLSSRSSTSPSCHFLARRRHRVQ